MGWADCGKNNTTGENMGYGWPGKCHKRECKTAINRGLAHVCGGMHEGDIYGCGYYFCTEHLCYLHVVGDKPVQLCAKCLAAVEKELKADGYVMKRGCWVPPADSLVI